MVERDEREVSVREQNADFVRRPGAEVGHRVAQPGQRSGERREQRVIGKRGDKASDFAGEMPDRFCGPGAGLCDVAAQVADHPADARQDHVAQQVLVLRHVVRFVHVVRERRRLLHPGLDRIPQPLDRGKREKRRDRVLRPMDRLEHWLQLRLHLVPDFAGLDRDEAGEPRAAVFVAAGAEAEQIFDLGPRAGIEVAHRLREIPQPFAQTLDPVPGVAGEVREKRHHRRAERPPRVGQPLAHGFEKRRDLLPRVARHLSEGRAQVAHGLEQRFAITGGQRGEDRFGRTEQGGERLRDPGRRAALLAQRGEHEIKRAREFVFQHAPEADVADLVKQRCDLARGKCVDGVPEAVFDRATDRTGGVTDKIGHPRVVVGLPLNHARRCGREGQRRTAGRSRGQKHGLLDGVRDLVRQERDILRAFTGAQKNVASNRERARLESECRGVGHRTGVQRNPTQIEAEEAFEAGADGKMEPLGRVRCFGMQDGGECGDLGSQRDRTYRGAGRRRDHSRRSHGQAVARGSAASGSNRPRWAMHRSRSRYGGRMRRRRGHRCWRAGRSERGDRAGLAFPAVAATAHRGRCRCKPRHADRRRRDAGTHRQRCHRPRRHRRRPTCHRRTVSTPRHLARTFHTRRCEVFALLGRLRRGKPRQSRSAQRADGNFAEEFFHEWEISRLGGAACPQAAGFGTVGVSSELNEPSSLGTGCST